jgi:hypothetical protein
MPQDPARVDAELVGGVRAHAENADDAEVRAALATLTPAEQKRLGQLLRHPPAGRFSPFGWADLARGTDPQVAAAREVSGYYALLAERDALAAMVGEPKPRASRPPTRTPPAGPAREKKRRAPGPGAERSQHLLGLFAYHRDAPSVARSLGIALEELNAELETLGVRRQAYRIARAPDAQMPQARPVAGPRTPPVRRRSSRTPAPPSSPETPLPQSEQENLKTLLAELGPRRALLADRLGSSGGALLARFRAAGLEREFSLRERDLIRALWSKHRGSESKVAAELQMTPEALRDIAVQRGIARELESVRNRLRREALRRRWPQERIEQLLYRREELRELGVLEGLEREVAVRAGVIWTSLAGKRDALELFAKKLHLSPADAVRLQKLLHLS